MPAYPVVGSLPAYRWPTGVYTGEHYDQALFDIRRRYGPIVREWRGWRRKLAVHVFEVCVAVFIRCI
jgi:hypothetical protein